MWKKRNINRRFTKIKTFYRGLKDIQCSSAFALFYRDLPVTTSLPEASRYKRIIGLDMDFFLLGTGHHIQEYSAYQLLFGEIRNSS